MKYFIVFLFLILILPIGCKTVSNKHKQIELFHRVVENDTSTIITNFTTDSIFIKGKWNRMIFKDYKSHGIQLINKDTLISFFPYPKNKSMVYNKKHTNEKFFKRYESERTTSWNMMRLYNKKIKSDTNFSIHYVEKELVLIGAKEKNTFQISHFAPDNIREEKKINFLINFFNNIQE